MADVPLEQPYTQWEYRVFQIPHGAPDPVGINDQLNQLGLDGWELIGAEGHYVFLKRVIPPGTPI